MAWHEHLTKDVPSIDVHKKHKWLQWVAHCFNKHTNSVIFIWQEEKHRRKKRCSNREEKKENRNGVHKRWVFKAWKTISFILIIVLFRWTKICWDGEVEEKHLKQKCAFHNSYITMAKNACVQIQAEVAAYIHRMMVLLWTSNTMTDDR